MNALIGAEVLSTASVPLTSVVTVVRHAAVAGVTVWFRDGRRAAVALEDLDMYTTERRNPSNTKDVTRVDVEYPTAGPLAGVRIVDTPGIGSVYVENTAVTMDFIPRVDAAVIVLSADQPASHSELDFVESVRRHVDKLFFVVNKIDLISGAERGEIVAFVRKALVSRLGESPLRLHAISARDALAARLNGSADALEQSGLVALERDLAVFLSEQRGAVLRAAARRRVREWIRELAGAVELRRRALLIPVATLGRRIEEFESRSERAGWNRAAIEGLLATASRRLVEELEKTHGSFVADRTPNLVASLEHVYAGAHGGRRELVETLNRTLKEGVQRVVDEWAAEEAARVHRELAAMLDRLRAESNALMGELTSLLQELFGATVNFSAELADFSIDSPHATVEPMFSLMLDEMPLFLPASLARRVIRRRFIRAAPEEIARNLSRATAEFRQRLLEASRVFGFQFSQHMDQLVASLKEALVRARDARARAASDVTAESAELDRHAVALSTLLERIESHAAVAA